MPDGFTDGLGFGMDVELAKDEKHAKRDRSDRASACLPFVLPTRFAA